MLITVDATLLDLLTERAKGSPRLRMNHNFHPDDRSSCHRLLNAIEPGSYIQPHRHLDREKDETFVLLRGELGVITFTDSGEIDETALLKSGSDRTVLTIPNGVFHTAVSLQSGTIFFEAKAGPYIPFTEAERGGWAPADGSPEIPLYLEKLCRIFLQL